MKRSGKIQEKQSQLEEKKSQKGPLNRIKMWNRKKEKKLEDPSKSLEQLKISGSEGRSQEDQEEKTNSKILKLQRGKYNLEPSEVQELMSTVFKPRNAEQEALKLILRELVRSVLEEGHQREQEDSEML